MAWRADPNFSLLRKVRHFTTPFSFSRLHTFSHQLFLTLSSSMSSLTQPRPHEPGLSHFLFYVDLSHFVGFFWFFVSWGFFSPLISPFFFSHLSFSSLTGHCALFLFPAVVHDPPGYRYQAAASPEPPPAMESSKRSPAWGQLSGPALSPASCYPYY